MDNYWLVNALRYGGVGFLLLAACVFFTLQRAWKQKLSQPSDIIARNAVMFALVALIVMAITVHLWGACNVLFAFLLGASCWTSVAEKQPEAPVRDRKDPLKRNGAAQTGSASSVRDGRLQS